MQRDVKNCGYVIGKHTEKSHHQHRDWRLREVKWQSTMIGGSCTTALVRACDDIIIIITITKAITKTITKVIIRAITIIISVSNILTLILTSCLYFLLNYFLM